MLRSISTVLQQMTLRKGSKLFIMPWKTKVYRSMVVGFLAGIAAMGLLKALGASDLNLIITPAVVALCVVWGLQLICSPTLPDK